MMRSAGGVFGSLLIIGFTYPFFFISVLVQFVIFLKHKEQIANKNIVMLNWIAFGIFFGLFLLQFIGHLFGSLALATTLSGISGLNIIFMIIVQIMFARQPDFKTDANGTDHSGAHTAWIVFICLEILSYLIVGVSISAVYYNTYQLTNNAYQLKNTYQLAAEN